jgi:hypothetical protein
VRGKIVAALAAASALATSLHAATITVTHTADDGPGSVRNAIATASRGDDIVFDPSLAGRPIILTTGRLLIDKDLTITGLGRGLTILDGNGTDRVLEIAEGAMVTLTGLTTRNGLPRQVVPGESGDEVVSEGGGIYNAGTLTLVDTAIENNGVSSVLCAEGSCDTWRIRSVRGGGIFNRGTLLMSGGAVAANRADSASPLIEGGGIYNSGIAVLAGTTISGNAGTSDRAAGVQGAGLFNGAGGIANLYQVQVVGNGAEASPAVVNAGALHLERSTIALNGAWIGGGLENGGTATVIDSVIAGNRSGAGGLQRGYAAGITNRGSLTLTRSTVSRNSGEGTAGIVNNGGTLRAANSTVAGNDTFMGIAGIHNAPGGATLLSHTTVAGNTGVDCGSGYGVRNEPDSPFDAQGTLVAGNLCELFPDPRPSDCSGLLESLGHNLLGDGDGCHGFVDGVAGDIVETDWTAVVESTTSGVAVPALADNGGPTPTVALLPGSPAIDAVPVAACRDADANPLVTDQRGVARPQGIACDIGAFEYSPPRGTGFWSHQCGGHGYTQVSAEEMQARFDQAADASPAFPECAPVGCDALRPDIPQSDMRAKAGRSLLGLRLNVLTGRVTRGRPIDLPSLTQAADAGDALAEIERTICDPDASHNQLGIAKDLAEAINNQGEDMELVSVETSVTALAGSGRSFSFALINMSPDVRSYDLTAAGPWPVSFSPARVGGLGPGQIAMITATVSVPADNTMVVGEVSVTAVDRDSEASLQRTATVPVVVGGSGPAGGRKTRPRR